MPRAAKKTSKRNAEWPVSYIFEIGKWELAYHFSVDHGKYRDGPYSEHTGIQFEACCIFPETFKGRLATFDIAGRRDCLTPPILEREPDWIPRCVGELELQPTSGRFYTSIPHDSLTLVLTAFAQGLFRFILVYGPLLKRSKSLCSSMQLMQSVNLEDY